MNILTSTPTAHVKHLSTPTATPKAVVADEAPEGEEPKDGFSLGRTLSTGLLGFMNRRIPSTTAEVSEEKSKALQEKIKPGDVLMSADMSYPGWARMEYWAIGSHYTHAAIVGSDGAVYEAVGEGVTKSTVAEFLEGRKKIAVARPGLSEADTSAATEFAKSHIGKAYDGAFDYGDDSEFYCSELVAKALDAGEAHVATPRGSLLGKEAIAPDAFLKIPGVEIVHDDKSNYWTNKAGYWPIAASTVGLGIVGNMLGGLGGAAIGAGAGFLGSILVGNKIQTGQYSPSLAEIRAGKH